MAVRSSNRWDEKAGLQRDALSSQVTDALEARETRRPAMKKLTTMMMEETLNKQDKRLTIGLDLGDRSSFYCVLGEAGEVLLEQKVSTTPKAIREVFGAISRSRIFTIHRVDPDRSYSSAYAPKGKLFTAEYTGSIVGNHLTGKVFACT